MSSTQSKLYDKAKANGTSYASPAKAQSAFKSKMASDPKMKSQYTSKYTSQPTTRPSHIPSSYKDAGGVSRNIGYNQQYGGYGYMGPSGSWIMYDMMLDGMMMNQMMGHHGYYGGHAPMYAPVHHGGGGGFLAVLGTIILLIFIGVVVIAVIKGIASA